jgi:hypothetical protein
VVPLYTVFCSTQKHMVQPGANITILRFSGSALWSRLRREAAAAPIAVAPERSAPHCQRPPACVHVCVLCLRVCVSVRGNRRCLRTRQCE